MDIKLNNSTGDFYIKNGDISFFEYEEKYFEILQQIILMLHIREGELEYDINYGLNFKKLYGTHGEIEPVLEHIREKIYSNFRDYLSKCIVEFYSFENRKLKINLILEFKENKGEFLKLEGVGIGWQEQK